MEGLWRREVLGGRNQKVRKVEGVEEAVQWRVAAWRDDQGGFRLTDVLAR